MVIDFVSSRCDSVTVKDNDMIPFVQPVYLPESHKKSGAREGLEWRRWKPVQYCIWIPISMTFEGGMFR